MKLVGVVDRMQRGSSMAELPLPHAHPETNPQEPATPPGVGAKVEAADSDALQETDLEPEDQETDDPAEMKHGRPFSWRSAAGAVERYGPFGGVSRVVRLVRNTIAKWPKTC